MSRLRYRLQFPADLSAAEVLDFTRALSTRPRHGFFGQADPVSLETVASRTRIEWYVESSEREAQALTHSLRANVPRVRYERVEEPAAIRYERGLELRLSDQQRHLRTDVAEQSSRAVLSALQGLHGGEVLTVSWLIGPWLPRQAVPPAATRKKNESGVTFKLPAPQRDSEQVAALRKKQQEAVFGVVGRLLVRADGIDRQRQLLQRLLGALQMVRSSGVGFQRRLVLPAWVPTRAARRQRPFIAWPNALSAAELASVLGWPVGGPLLTGVTYGGQRQLPPPDGALVRRPDRHRVTGRSTYPGRDGCLHLPADQARRHLWAIGPTGSGKSTLLANLALQDMQGSRGVIVLDPAGDLVTNLLERVPAHRADDVIVLDASDRRRPVGLNPLRGEPELAVDTVLHILRELYAANWGPRTSDILHAGLTAHSPAAGGR